MLEHSLLSVHFQESVCNGGFSPVLSCRLQSCNFIKWQLHMSLGIFFNVFGAAISKYDHEIISDRV